MKKILLLLSVIVLSIAAFSQGQPCPNYQPQGSPTTRWSQQGIVQGVKGFINGIYPDTLTANNTSCADYYTGSQIVTTNGKIQLWLRDNPAYRWINVTNNIVSNTFNTDSSLVICYSNGACDTIPIYNFTNIVTNIVNNILDTTIINGGDTYITGGDTLIVCNGTGACDTILLSLDSVNNFYFIDSTHIVVCDTPQVITVGDSSYIQQVCDTINIPKQTALRFQNGVQQISPGIVEHGSPNNQPNPSQLQKDTYLYTDFYNYGITGAPYLRPTLSVQNKQWTNISQSVASFNSLGNNIYFRPTQIDNENPVNLYLNYINPMAEGNGVFAGDTIGTMLDRIGYAWMTNSQGSRAGYELNSSISKQVGTMYHTLDTLYTDAITFFANQTPNRYLFSVSPFPTTTLLDSRIAVFHTDKSANFLGKVFLTNGRLEPDTALIASANNLTLGLGNVNIVSGDTQINAITTSGWQAGSSPVYLVFSGAPLVKNNTAGGAGTATIILAGATDFQAAAGDVLGILYDGTNWRETNRALAGGSGVANANNGLSLSGTTVQLGQAIGAGTPAALLSHREIPMANFTLNFNADAAQSNNMTVWKNSSAAIRARITSAASFSNTGGQSSSEIFGDEATVSGANSVAIGNGASAPAQSIVIGRATSSTSTGSDVIIGGVSSASNPGTVLIGIGSSSTGSGGNNVAIGTSISITSAQSVGVGYNTSVTGANSVRVGASGSVGHEYSQAYGFGATTTAANQLVYGAATAATGGINDAYYGRGVASADANDFKMQPSGRVGTDLAGNNFTIAAGKATGNAASGVIIFQTSTAGASGTTLQTLANKIQINGSGILAYNGVMPTSGSGGTDSTIFRNSSTGQFYLAPGSAVITADNGLTKNTATNVRLGGTLVENTTVATAGFTTTWTGAYTSGAPAMFNVINTSSGTAFTATAAGANAAMSGSNSSTGDGILAINTSSGNALNATSITGLAGRFRANPSSTNSTVSVARFIRGSSGTPDVDMGGSIELYLESTSADDRLSNALISRWKVPTDASRESELNITGVTGAATETWLTLGKSGYMKLRAMTVAEAGALTAADGQIIYVSDTDGTFTSVGFWGRENGAWVKL